MRGVFLILVLSISLHATGQGRLAFSIGYASYNQADLKEFQEDLLTEYPVDAKITESFPPYWHYDGSFDYLLNNEFIVGLVATYGSSGGRTHYEDYSGEIRNDMLLNYVSIGAVLGIVLNPEESQWQLSLELTPAISFSKMKLKFYNRVGTEQDFRNYSFKSTNWTLQPSLHLTRKLKNFGLNLQAGYCGTIVKGDVFLDGGYGAYLVNDSSGEKIHIDWSGFRIALGLSYTFNSY